MTLPKVIPIRDPKAALRYYEAVQRAQTRPCGHHAAAHGPMGCEGVQQDGPCACKAAASPEGFVAT